MAMRFKPKGLSEGTQKRTLTRLSNVNAGAAMPWVSAAKLLRKKRKGPNQQRETQQTFVKALGEEFPRWGHSHIEKE